MLFFKNSSFIFLFKGSSLGAQLQQSNDKGKPSVIQVDHNLISLSDVCFLLLVLSYKREDYDIFCQYFELMIINYFLQLCTLPIYR